MTTENKYRIAFLFLFLISCLFFFDIIRIDMEDKSLKFPVYMSGEPADMPVVEERLGTVKHAACSGSEDGQKAVQKHALIRLKQKTDELGGNAVIDVTTDYGPHPDLDENCPFGVFVSGTAVVLEK